MGLTAAETLKLATYTLHEAEAMSLSAGGLKTAIGGLSGGALQADRHGGAKLVHYSDIAGVTLDGYVAPDLSGNGPFMAYVKIGGARAVAGLLTERHGKLTSSLDPPVVPTGVESAAGLRNRQPGYTDLHGFNQGCGNPEPKPER